MVIELFATVFHCFMRSSALTVADFPCPGLLRSQASECRKHENQAYEETHSFHLKFSFFLDLFISVSLNQRNIKRGRKQTAASARSQEDPYRRI
jgi:hypothetical protein